MLLAAGATACGATSSDPGTPPSDEGTTLVAAGDVGAAAAESTKPSAPVSTDTAASVAEPLRTHIDARGVVVEIASIDRIIPLDGDVAEIVFALGMGDHVVATDLSATYPPEADALPQIGYQRALDAEPILEFEPTLLIGTDVGIARWKTGRSSHVTMEHGLLESTVHRILDDEVAELIGGPDRDAAAG